MLRYGALAALAGSIWSAILSLAAVPVYLSRLGIEAYGVIGFFLTTQAIMQVFDLGLAPAVNREMARATTPEQVDTARTLLRTLGRVYWLTGLAIAITFLLAAAPVAASWFGESRLSREDLTKAIMLMGLVVAARWPIALYQNTLIGRGRLGSTSAVGAAMTTISVAASVTCVKYWSPTLPALFTTQAVAMLAYALVIKALAWRALGGRAGAAFDMRSVRTIWRFSLGMGAVTLTGIALTQFDKTLLSRLLSLELFGEYMLAATVVGGLSLVVAPLFNVIYPRFSFLVANRLDDALRNFNEQASCLFAIAYLPIVIALAIYSTDILQLWTGNAIIARRVGPLVTILCFGSAINGLMYFPYSLQLAYGRSRVPLAINSVLLVVMAPLIFMLANRYGAMGGAMAWAILEALYLALGTIVTQRLFPVFEGGRWVRLSIGLPLLATGGIALVLHPILEQAPSGSLLKVSLIASSVVLSYLACALMFPRFRAPLLNRLKALAVVPRAI